MENGRIPKSWLTVRVNPQEPEYSFAVRELCPNFERGDELWHFDEPAPPEINAGELGIALVRDGKPIRSIITGIH